MTYDPDGSARRLRPELDAEVALPWKSADFHVPQPLGGEPIVLRFPSSKES